ncbi:MAG: carboxy terminal-processing peptidase [Pseudomonadota bacterium]
MIKIINRNFIAITLVLSFTSVSTATEATALSPSDDHERVSDIITDFLGRYHYRRVQLDDDFSQVVYDTYLSTLDPTKSYFLESDILGFNQYEFALDDALQNDDLIPAYEIFSIYQQRVNERIDYALELIEKEDFDFTIDESFQISRKDADWPSSAEELDDLWRKRIKNDVLSLKLADKDPEYVKETLTKRYENIKKRSNQIDEDDIFQLYINSYATSIDPHTSYLSPRTFDNFEIRMSLSLEGIGALLRTDGDHTIVERIIPGGPADLSSLLHAKDKIVGIAQQDDERFTDVIGWRLEEVVDLIRGPKDTVVRLRILPGSKGQAAAVEEIALTRDEIKLEEQAAQKTILDIDDQGSNKKVGVITVPTFYLDFAAYQAGDKDYRSTTKDVQKLLEELQQDGIDSLVLDLRSNGGGSLIEATQLAGLFIRKGPIVQVRDSSGHIDIQSDTNSKISYQGPMVVLVDRFSASASEIVASALQDYGRAVIVGETTFGKGSVQQLIDLNRYAGSSDNSLGQLKATIAQYFRVNGESTQHRGVVPDILFEASYDETQHGESSLDNALPWTKITPAKRPHDQISSDIIKILGTQHDERVKEDEKYQSLVNLYNLNEELQNRTDVSLNRADREKLFTQLEEDRKNYEMLIGIYKEDEEDEEIVVSDIEPKDEEDYENDILLKEAAYISADLQKYWNQDKQMMIVERSSDEAILQ